MDQTVRSRTGKKFKFELRMFRRQLAYRQRWRGQIWEAVLQTKRSNKYSSWYWNSAPCLMRAIHRNMYIENGGDDRPGFGWQVEPEKDIGVQFGLWLGVWSRETDEGDTYNINEFENQTISEMAIRGRWSPSNWKDLFQVKITKRCQNMRRHTYTGKADPARMIQVLPFFIISFLTSLDHLKKSQRHWWSTCSLGLSERPLSYPGPTGLKWT